MLTTSYTTVAATVVVLCRGDGDLGLGEGLLTSTRRELWIKHVGLPQCRRNGFSSTLTCHRVPRLFLHRADAVSGRVERGAARSNTRRRVRGVGVRRYHAVVIREPHAVVAGAAAVCTAVN